MHNPPIWNYIHYLITTEYIVIEVIESYVISQFKQTSNLLSWGKPIHGNWQILLDTCSKVEVNPLQIDRQLIVPCGSWTGQREALGHDLLAHKWLNLGLCTLQRLLWKTPQCIQHIMQAVLPCHSSWTDHGSSCWCSWRTLNPDIHSADYTRGLGNGPSTLACFQQVRFALVSMPIVFRQAEMFFQDGVKLHQKVVYIVPFRGSTLKVQTSKQVWMDRF